MEKLLIKGVQDFLGRKVPIIEGGFGEGQKVVLAKTVAEIHGVDLKRVNELINKNLDEFEVGVDILNLKGHHDFEVVATDHGFITSNGQKFCYLLSEQGYMALVGLMRTEKAREIRKQFRREYFAMRQVINSNEQLKAQLLLHIYNGGQDGVLASKQLADLEVKEATKPLLEKIDEDKPKVEAYTQFMDSDGLISLDDTARIIGVGKSVMLKKLRELEILMTDVYLTKTGDKRFGGKHNLPYQQYMKYFEVKILPPSKNGECYKKVFVKPEAIEYINKKVNN